MFAIHPCVSRIFRVLLLLLSLSIRAACQENAPEPGEPAPTIDPIATVSALSEAFRQAAQRVIPATLKVVVHLRTSEERTAGTVESTLIARPSDGRRPGDLTGTGFLVDPKGIILTNHHVIAPGKELEVELADGRKFPVIRVRSDTATDLAVLWIRAPERLPFALLGDSDFVDIGDWVLAVGNPFELDLTVSAGIISARGRSVRSVQRADFLQTDASINPGNSGGPLINMQGEVIGVNTLIVSSSGLGQGIGFALPSNTARWVLRQLVAKGRVERAWFGAVTSPITDAVAKKMKVTPREGLLVDYIIPSSPAEESPLRRNDILLTFDGEPLKDVVDYYRMEERAEIGVEHEMILLRDGRKRRMKFHVTAREEEATVRTPTVSGRVQASRDEKLGLLLFEMPAEVSSRYGFGGRTGMAVLDVLPGSRAERAGLKKGMLIVKLDGGETPGRAAYFALREKSSLSEGIVFGVLVPGGGESTVTLKLGQ